ncbi:MAG: hypothetical protein ACRDB1_13730 [Microcoleaceae cyanobacterium]
MNTKMCMNIEKIDAELTGLESPVILGLASICYQATSEDIKACGEILLAMSELSGPAQELVIKAMLDRAKPNWV